MCSCPINSLDFWYNGRNNKDGLNNSEFAILYDLVNGHIYSLPHLTASLEKLLLLLLIMLKQK